MKFGRLMTGCHVISPFGTGFCEYILFQLLFSSNSVLHKNHRKCHLKVLPAMSRIGVSIKAKRGPEDIVRGRWCRGPRWSQSPAVSICIRLIQKVGPDFRFTDFHRLWLKREYLPFAGNIMDLWTTMHISPCNYPLFVSIFWGKTVLCM